MKNSITAILNTDVELTILKAKGETSHVENMMAAVNAVNWDKALIKEYVDAFASAVIAQGMNPDSVKVLKSNRKCILEFSAGLRKGQEDKEFWSPEACRKMAMELGKEAGDISGYAKACREAINDEKEDPKWILEEKLAKLIDKAMEEGYKDSEIMEALNKALIPDIAA